MGVLLVFFTLLLYVNTLWNDYNLDDELVTRNHPLTSKGISAIPEIFSSPYYQDQMGYKFEYRPVVLASFAIEHTLFGQHAFVSHLINVLLYAGTVLLLYRLLIQLFVGLPHVVALIIGLLFAAHPLHTEVVANIKNRDEILALLLGIASWHAAVVFMKHTKRQWGRLAIVALLFLLAMLSKQSIVSLALLIPLSLVMFLNIDEMRLFLLSMVLALITAMIIPLDLFMYRVLFFVGLSLAPWLFKKIFYDRIWMQFFTFIRNKWLQFSTQRVTDNEVPLFFFNRHITYTLGIVALLIAGTATAWAIYFAWTALLFWVFIGLLVLLLMNANRGLSGWLLLMLCVVAMILHEWHQNGGAYDLFLLFVFLMTITFPERFSRRHVLFSYALLSLYALIKLDQIFIPYLLFMVLFLFLKHESAFFLLLVISLIKFFAAAGHILMEVMNNRQPDFLFYEELVPALLSVLTLGAFLIKPFRKTSYYIVVGAVTGLYAYYFYFMAPDFQGLRDLEQIRYSPINVLPESDRPILFQEMPVRFDTPFSKKLGTGFYVLGEYLRLMILPHPLRFYYGYAHIVPVKISHPMAVFSMIIHAIMMIVALWLIHKNRILSFGLLFYLVSISTFSNILYPVVGVIAERLSYVATIGYCVVVGYLIARIFKIDIQTAKMSRIPPFLVVVLLLILIPYSAKTVIRNAQWKNHLTLMRHDIKYLEKSAQAHNLLAQNIMKYSFQQEYADQAPQMYREAIRHFKKSAEIYPHFLNVWYDMGRVYVLLHEKDSAYVCFLKAHDLDSTFAWSAYNAALIAEEKQDYHMAIRHYESAIRNDPHGMIDAFYKLGHLYYRIGELDKSAAINKKGVEYFPQHRGFYENLSTIYYQLKDTTKAEYYKREAARRPRGF